MKTPPLNRTSPSRRPARSAWVWLATLLSCLLSGALPAAQNAEAPPNKALSSPAPLTNSAPAEPPIPQSIFVIPKTPQEGRDPFFPASTRMFQALGGAKTNHLSSTPHLADLTLKGVSGAIGRRFAIINNQTFAVGEEHDLLLQGVKVRVRCLEIGERAATILAGGERRELKLRKGF